MMGYVVPPFSIWILLGLLLVLGASSVVFWIHVRRWTLNRTFIALRDWAGSAGMKLNRPPAASVPLPLASLTLPPPSALISLAGQRTVLLQMDTPAQAGGSPQRWNVLVREMEAVWPVTALRPSTHERSLVDLFALTPFPSLLSSERFTVHGVESLAARAMTASKLMALLPKDLGLVLHGRRLIMDFSTRPFDEIELSRVVALADQLVQNLPSLVHE